MFALLGAIACIAIVIALVVFMGGSGSSGKLTASEQQTSSTGAASTTSTAVTEAANTETSVVSTSTTQRRDPEAAAADELNKIADSQQSTAEGLVGKWVPQVDSKSVGLVAEGKTWDHQSILANYRQYKSTYPEALLIRSDEFASFNPAFWVVLVDDEFGDADGALGWCRSEGFDRDHCYAHLITHDTSIAHTTAYLPN